MLLSEIFTQLSYGEASQLYIGGSGTGLIELEHYPTVINHVNLALIELYKRFNLSVKTITLEQIADRNDYELHNNYAVTDPNSTDDVTYPKYIIDTATKPFLNDILKIDYIKDEDSNDIPINDDSYTTSVIITGVDNLYIPEPVEDDLYYITYRAAPTTLDINLADPSATEVDLPIQFMEPLVNYVAYRIFASMGSGGQSEVNYYAKFEASCALVIRMGLNSIDEYTGTKLTDNGWV